MRRHKWSQSQWWPKVSSLLCHIMTLRCLLLRLHWEFTVVYFWVPCTSSQNDFTLKWTSVIFHVIWRQCGQWIRISVTMLLGHFGEKIIKQNSYIMKPEIHHIRSFVLSVKYHLQYQIQTNDTTFDDKNNLFGSTTELKLYTKT